MDRAKPGFYVIEPAVFARLRSEIEGPMPISDELFGKTVSEQGRSAGAALQGSGILPFQQIKALIRDHEIWSETDILPGQVQPASLDLRLGPLAYRVRASFLPGEGASVADKIQQFAM